jgi:hypothetical protein
MQLAPIRFADDHIGTGLASVKGVFLPRAVMVE